MMNTFEHFTFGEMQACKKISGLHALFELLRLINRLIMDTTSNFYLKSLYCTYHYYYFNAIIWLPWQQNIIAMKMKHSKHNSLLHIITLFTSNCVRL